MLLAGADLFMMMHPAAVKALQDICKQLISGERGNTDKLVEWVSTRV
jgi:CO dehydrogenase/acetyl-CoA synthase delta subunit